MSGEVVPRQPEELEAAARITPEDIAASAEFAYLFYTRDTPPGSCRWLLFRRLGHQ